jgi:hypothetical protein
MTKEHKKEQSVIQETVIYTEYFCDVCKKILYTRWNKEDRKIFGQRPIIDYYTVVTGHNDWGRDSCDSREEQLVCPECLTTVFMQYKNSSERVKNNTNYIEIDHACTYDDGEYKEGLNEY